MVLDTLEGIPAFDMPEPYGLRWYQTGDERHWIDIHIEADKPFVATPELFRREFGYDEAALAQRQLYVVDGDGVPVGTASAWFDAPETHPSYAGYGRVHWVAIHPAHQGKGLARPLMHTVLGRLRDLGYTQAYLDTDTNRPVAIHLYERFSFRRMNLHDDGH